MDPRKYKYSKPNLEGKDTLVLVLRNEQEEKFSDSLLVRTQTLANNYIKYVVETLERARIHELKCNKAPPPHFNHEGVHAQRDELLQLKDLLDIIHPKDKSTFQNILNYSSFHIHGLSYDINKAEITSYFGKLNEDSLSTIEDYLNIAEHPEQYNLPINLNVLSQKEKVLTKLAFNKLVSEFYLYCIYNPGSGKILGQLLGILGIELNGTYPNLGSIKCALINGIENTPFVAKLPLIFSFLKGKFPYCRSNNLILLEQDIELYKEIQNFVGRAEFYLCPSSGEDSMEGCRKRSILQSLKNFCVTNRTEDLNNLEETSFCRYFPNEWNDMINNIS
jgi:hypothetical protein